MRRTYENAADKEDWLNDPFTIAHREWLTHEVQKRLQALIQTASGTTCIVVARAYERFHAVDRELAFFTQVQR